MWKHVEMETCGHRKRSHGNMQTWKLKHTDMAKSRCENTKVWKDTDTGNMKTWETCKQRKMQRWKHIQTLKMQSWKHTDTGNVQTWKLTHADKETRGKHTNKKAHGCRNLWTW